MNGRIDGRIYGIQLVRAIACLGIVIAHSFAYAEFNFETMGSGALDFGAVMVCSILLQYFLLYLGSF